MKQFERDGKFNFVDINNVFVGYDSSQSCCEDANWFISDSITPYRYDCEFTSTPDITEYVFDKNYFEYVDADLDSGGQVAFKLTAKNKPDLYLQLYNCHNGYYGHGFVFKDNDTVLEEEYL